MGTKDNNGPEVDLVIKNYYNSQAIFAFTILLGFYGIYRFSRRQIAFGILYIFTAGLFLVGWFYDIYLAFQDYKADKRVYEKIIDTSNDKEENTQPDTTNNRDKLDKNIIINNSVLNKLSKVLSRYVLLQDPVFIDTINGFIEKNINIYERHFEYYYDFIEGNMFSAINIANVQHSLNFVDRGLDPVICSFPVNFINNVYSCTNPFGFIHDIKRMSTIELESRYSQNMYPLIDHIIEQIEQIDNLLGALINTNQIKNVPEDKYSVFIILNEIRLEKIKENAENDLIKNYEIDISSTSESIIKDVLLQNIDYDRSKLSAYLAVLKSEDNKSYYTRINELEDETNHIYKKISSQIFLDSLRNKEKSKSVDIDDIDMMSGIEFECFITDLFIKLGYKSEKTKDSADQGIDVICEKKGIKYAIQTKCYSKPVGNHAVMEAVAGAKYYKADKAMVITNSTFTKSAKELALSNGVILWDRNILKEKIEQV